jgi:hypothetical protein
VCFESLSLQGADQGDTTTIHTTLPEAAEQLEGWPSSPMMPRP